MRTRRFSALHGLSFFFLAWPLSLLATDSGAATPSFKRGVNISHWLSQNYAERPYAAPWFTEKDVAWIASQGFDHIRFPIDGRLWLKPDGSLDDSKIVPFENALKWANRYGLGSILDMHFLPGASFDPGAQDNAVFVDEALQKRVADFWRLVAKRFAHHGPYLRFELLNEPVAADNLSLNKFSRVMLAAIRESNPDRAVYITSNRWSSFGTVQDVEVPADPHVAITLHFYEPMIFTHQRASWVKLPADMPAVEFPGKVPDLSAVLKADSPYRKLSGTDLTVADLESAFERVAAWVAKTAPGREIYIGEFGVYQPASAASKRAYIAAVVHATERRGWSWAVWDYRGGFAVRDPKGEPTPILEGLFKQAGAAPVTK